MYIDNFIAFIYLYLKCIMFFFTLKIMLAWHNQNCSFNLVKVLLLCDGHTYFKKYIFHHCTKCICIQCFHHCICKCSEKGLAKCFTLNSKIVCIMVS